MSGRLPDDQLDRLGDRIADQLRSGRRQSHTPSATLYAEVGGYLVAYPDATGNAVVAAVDGRRQDVLRAVREIRGAATRFLFAGNRHSGSGSQPVEKPVDPDGLHVNVSLDGEVGS